MNFVVFAPNPWRDIWRNRQQIFSRLAGRHRILYIEPARASLADWRRGQIAWRAVRQPAAVEERPGLWLYRIPALLPSRDTGGRVDRFTDRLLASHLRHTLRRLDFLGSAAPYLWLYRPTRWRWAASAVPHDLLVYHVTDDYTAFGHLSAPERDALAAAERSLLTAADLTIVTAPRLLELKAPLARRIELVPNAVDFAAFQRALAEPRSLPALAALPAAPGRPTLGYSGHISRRLDLSLLHQLALARPGWQLVLAGSVDARGCESELAALRALANVVFLDPLPVEDVPRLIAAFDVGLIPYRVDDETRAVSSLKLYEYLAAGKPVVSARVPAAEEQGAVVEIAEADSDAWQAAIDRALAAARDPQAIARRLAVAAANTWDQRVQHIEALLADCAAAKEGRSAG